MTKIKISLAEIFNSTKFLVVSCLLVLAICGVSSTAYAYTSGSVGSWVTSPNSLPQDTFNPSYAEYNGYAYIIGGASGGLSTYDTVYTAPLNSDGSVGSWTSQSNVLPQSLSSPETVSYNGYIYVMGGIDHNGLVISTVYYAPLLSSGGIGSWSTSSNPLLQDLFESTAVAYNGYIYVIGGFNNSTFQDTVYSAAVNPDGSIDSWTTISNTLPTALYGLESIVYNGYVYIIGGSGAGNNSNIYSAQLESGNISSWATSPNAVPRGLFVPSVGTYNGYLYVMGGLYNGTSDAVYLAPLSSNGAVGVFTTSTNSLPQSLYGASTIIFNGYVYVIGGLSMNTVYYAPISGYSSPDITNKSIDLVTGSSVTIDVLTGVSGNPDASSLQIITAPSHGKAVDPPGSITYTPDKGYVGRDSLDYKVCSADVETLCSQASLSFDVLNKVTNISAPATGFGAPKSTNIIYKFVVASFLLTLTGLGVNYLRKDFS